MANATTRWSFRSAIAATIIAGTIAGASALPVYDQLVTGDDLADDRSVGAGLTIGGGTATTASISWDIAFNSGTSLWSYNYAFTTNARQGISHFLLDLSDNCSANSGCVMNFEHNSGSTTLAYGTYTDANGNPNLPSSASIVGVKFDNLNVDGATYTFTFDSERAPVWGDFYAKGGNGQSNGFAVFNSGAGDHESELEINFIARPDTVSGPGPGPGGAEDVPAPASLLLLGVGLAGLAVGKRRRA